MFSATVWWGKSPTAGSRSRSRDAARPPAGRDARAAEQDLAARSSAISRLTSSIAVVLPEPDGQPARNLPAPTVRLRSWIAIAAPRVALADVAQLEFERRSRRRRRPRLMGVFCDLQKGDSGGRPAEMLPRRQAGLAKPFAPEPPQRPLCACAPRLDRLRAAVARHHVRAHHGDLRKRRLEYEHGLLPDSRRRPHLRPRASQRSAGGASAARRSRSPPPPTQAPEDIGFSAMTVSRSESISRSRLECQCTPPST